MALQRITWGHHAAVGVTIAGLAGLALFGVIGEPNRPERFDAKQVTVWPVGDDGVRIREVIDQDFGTNRRRGHQRFVPTDFGVPTDVSARSPTAPDGVSITDLGDEVRIRIGDPDVTITGRHRYVLEFTLPDARLSTGRLALDVIGTEEEFETERFEVVVAGLELADPTCAVGRFGAVGGCVLERDGDVYRTVIAPLRPGQGITVGGTIVARTEPVLPTVPELPERRPEHPRALLAAGLAALGVVTAGVVRVLRGRRGRNEITPGGATDAAFGSLPPPGSVTTELPTRLVSDRRLGDFATVEFAPPRGVEPWEGSVLVHERMSSDTIAAWFAGLAAREAIVLEPDGNNLTIRWGPKRDQLDVRTEEMLRGVLNDDQAFTLGTYDPDFASLWRSIVPLQDERIRTSGWWKHQPPQHGDLSGCSGWLIFMVASMVLLGLSPFLLLLLGLLDSVVLAVVFTVIVTALMARIAYRGLLPARSATGSALALQTESFRRFLDASEAQHVQWAWERGVLREYTAWATALGEAEAWNRALRSSPIPPETTADLASPMLAHTMRSSMVSSSTPPSESSSGSGSSGGSFSSGGSVGGGGGGGRSGSW